VSSVLSSIADALSRSGTRRPGAGWHHDLAVSRGVGGGRLIDKLFERFGQHLEAAGYIARGEQIIDATIVSAPKQRNTKEENEAIKAGTMPEGWEKQPAKNAQKDKDARSTKKNDESFYGYKTMSACCRSSGYVCRRRAGIAARLTRVHSYPYPSFLSHSWESLVIQSLASASVGKSFTCISGLSGNVTTTIQLCPAFMGRASNLISAPDLAMVAICAQMAVAGSR
jgi:hypothetical protein